VIKEYGLLGYRIIAMARKPLKDEDFFLNLDRKVAEKNMEFIGFLIMKSQV
jgi:magnesium-transporting ATPase (P-type)